MKLYIGKFNFILMLCVILIYSFCAQAAPSIIDYHQTFTPGFDQQNNLQIAIRSYEQSGKLYFLVVDPNSFATKIMLGSEFSSREIKPPHGHYTLQMLQQTPYVKALWKYTSPPYSLSNYGVKHAESAVNGVFLTIDMCPSVRPFEKNFFEQLVQLSTQSGKPIPIALSISGLWILKHPTEFKWLTTQMNNKKLNITWVNHTFSHTYYPDVPLENNFLLYEQTNIPDEILTVEKLLLENGQLPSVFFRAPGLITNELLISTLRKFGLIPLGANAWLAKQQNPVNGSIILVHGNSNEPEGIKLIMPILQSNKFIYLPLNLLFPTKN